jgi:hypothetical protein
VSPMWFLLAFVASAPVQTGDWYWRGGQGTGIYAVTTRSPPFPTEAACWDAARALDTSAMHPAGLLCVKGMTRP